MSSFSSDDKAVIKNDFEEKGWTGFEKDFTLEVPLNPQNDRVYSKGEKKDVPESNLYHNTNRQSKKVMVSSCLTWNGATKPFFVNSGGIKVNAVSYKKHLEKKH